MKIDLYLKLETAYDNFRKQNVYGFAHYFLAKWLTIVLCLFALIFLDNSNLISQFSIASLIVFFVGIVNELVEHGKYFYLVLDSRQDIGMNTYGIISGFMWSIAIFTLTVWFV